MSDPGDEHTERVAPAGGAGPGMPVPPATLERLTAELEQCRQAGIAVRLEIDQLHRRISERWNRFHAISDEERALVKAISRAGGGWDTDYYHRRRERAPGVIVTDGAHQVVEDRP